WKPDPSPYGVLLAGWSPQDHTNLTRNDLADPAKAGKYAVYNYLIANQVQATQTWAPAAAQALNHQYHTDVYQALDGETLVWGDEYCHTASLGHGVVGPLEPGLKGEILWG